jgi:NAD(P)-dependent dehydrogenase (short-subunit alcohol dehydrogenase family)
VTAADLVDRALEATVVGSFTRIGFHARRRLYRWEPLEAFPLDGRTAVVTGATSGLGRVAAEALARLGATVIVVGRDAERTERARTEIAAVSGTPVEAELADLSSLAETAALAERVRERHARVDVLVLNAGVLTHDYTLTAEGNELTFATHVLSQFLLTTQLRPLLEAAGSARVVTVSSGGAYTQPLDVAALQPTGIEFDGTRAYARCKRAQVTMAALWAHRLAGTGVRVNAMHPGWADTPGLRHALPGFARVVGPLLRTPEEGADSIVWLAAAPDAAVLNGCFVLDRRPRPAYRLAGTRRSDEPAEAERLWRLCEEETGGSSRSSR